MISDHLDTSADTPQVEARRDLPPFIRPAVDLVARIRATVHAKLLAGFLIITLLLMGMGALSIAVIERMNNEATKLVDLEHQIELARVGIYQVTAQSHFRAMALITQVDNWNDKITAAKVRFKELMSELAVTGGPEIVEKVDELEAIDARFAAAGQEVLALYQQGELASAISLHIQVEHEISHELEDDLNALIAQSDASIEEAAAELASLHRFLLVAVIVIAAVTLVAALGLGAVLSWSVIRPVRRVDRALARIADGDFGEKVEVPNRDEFGRLTANLNRTSSRLADIYQDLTTLNENLEKTVEDQLAQIRRAEQLRRYLSPQVADAVLKGEAPISLESTRRNLTILYSDIRGFTSMSERMEPEELIDSLNQYFTVMTDVVFRHGGTLDKYVGDGMLAFFGDPIPFEDHAERAVATAVEMRERMLDLRRNWLLRHDEELSIGIGISTGYVTVGNIGSDTRTDYTVIGNHVNIAARLASIAEADQILLSERTLTAVQNRFSASPLNELTLKGVNRPIRIFELTAASVDVARPPS